METCLGLLLVLITLAIIHIVQSQDQQGFISLDCGLPTTEPSPYKETDTGLWFSSDATFTRSGKTGRIKENLEGNSKPYKTLRYFPDGLRNCYNLSVDKGRRYLVRATFVYRNYDGLNNGPVFDLYLGPNPWAEIDLRQVNDTGEEILHIPTSDSLQICLVKNGTTTPVISTLELRPMEKDAYITKSGSLKLFFRRYYSNSGSNIRYMRDVYDRTWVPFFMKEWKQISTTLQVDISNTYVPSQDAIKNAATPADTSAPLTIKWSSKNSDHQYYLYAHFAEIQDLQANETREFNLSLNGVQFYVPFVPRKLAVFTVLSRSPRTCNGGECNFQLIRTNRSTLPPLLNALEVYTAIQFLQSQTDESDVDAVKNITATYALSRINWQGDPCVPQQLRWDGLNCRNTDMSTPPRITTLNLTSSGLTGTIAAAIQSLTQLETLDLSNNNLTGEVPEFLSNMESLSVM
ncbi:unnamed protein product [Microthlaspi erraticum]|uniref:Malectin-like domain-containing protein n=1 Tax=Microthlaspi erraticum TaxID=1685480 RepID=A0A6D2ISI3_9BRAS|nr:unnamed protein product [Microthlaspi erraticum]